MMKFSIITVCRNAENLIENTLKSVLSQKYSDLEYIIIDGASTDRTMDIINKYQNQIFTIISEPDQGIYDAMNKGINLSRGEFLYFLNAGDQFQNPEILLRITEFANNNPDCDIIYGDIQITNRSSQWIFNDKAYVGGIRNSRYLFNNMFCQQRAFFKKSVFERIGEFNTSYKIIADFDLVFRAFQQKFSFKYINTKIASIPLGGYSSIHFDKFLSERIHTLHSLPFWQWYWIFDNLVSAIFRGSILKYIKTKLFVIK